MTLTNFTTKDKRLTRGDTRRFRLTLTTSQPNPQTPKEPIDLTGCRLIFTMKRLRDDGKSVHARQPTIVKTSDDTSELEILDQGVIGNIGKAIVILMAADTRYLEPGIYGYDVQLQTAASDIYTVARGRIILEGDITSAEDLTNP